MAIDTTGPANKKSGTKTGGASPPPKKDYGSATKYAEFSKTKVGIGKDKKKG